MIATTKVFLSHLHADHIGDMPTLVWSLAVDHDTVGSALREMRARYDGPVVIAQDLTVFDITTVVARQATVEPLAWPVVSPG